MMISIEVFIGGVIAVMWLGIAIWGAASLISEARQTKSWEKVKVATLSAATVAGPILIMMPDHNLPLGGHTMGLGFILAFVSGAAILLTRPKL
jgi:hypothetical protein